MKRSVIIGSVCALLTVGVAWATQVWRDNTDGGNHSLANVSTIQANNGIGSGTRCAQFDSAGNLQPNASACGAGLGGSSGVSSVTGTAQRVSVTPTTGAPVVDTIGGFYSGAVTGGNEDLGTTLTNGPVCDTTTAGVAVLRSCASGTDFQAPMSAADGTVNFPTATTIRRTAITGDCSIGTGSNTCAVNNLPSGTTAAGFVNFAAIGAPSTPAVGTGDLYEDNVSANIDFKNGAGTVNHGIQTKTCGGSQWVNAISDAGGAACVQPAFTDVNGSLACAQLPALTGGVTSSAGSCATTVASVACAALPALTGAVTSSAGSCATTLASLAGKTPQTMFYAWDLQSTQAVSAGVMAEGGLNTSVGGGGMPNGYPALQSFTHVTMTLNVFNNVCTGGGSPLFQVNILRNGTLIVNVPVNCGFTGASTLGTVAFSAAAGDLIEFVYDGTLFGTSAGPRVTVALTARFDP